MSQPQLIYFGIPGRAHPIRLAFLIGGVEFEDKRLTFEEWGANCGDVARFPQGSVPVLIVAGKVLSDSAAILQYAAGRSGLLPADLWQASRATEIGVLIEQIYTGADAACSFVKSMRIEDEAEKKKAREGPFTDTVRYYLGLIAKIVASEGQDGFAVGNKLSVADLTIANVVSHLLSKDIDFFDDAFIAAEFPALVAIQKKVNAIPAVAQLNAAGLGY